MSGTIISLLAVTIGFTALVLWVYRPGARSHWEELGRLSLEDENDE